MVSVKIAGVPTTVVLLHGFAGTRRAWDPVVERLDPERYTPLAPDLRGHGDARDARPVTFEACVADVLAAAPERFVLCGYSMGGRIAQHVALAAPERVRTLTLAVTHGGVQKAGQLRGRLLGAYARNLPPEDQVDNLLYLCYTEAFFENEEMVEFMRTALLENPYPQPPEAFARQAAAGARHDLRERLGELAMPVHVIGAERDLMIPVWKSRELASLIPGSKLTILDAQGHGVQWEAADRFNAAVTEFLAATPIEAIR